MAKKNITFFCTECGAEQAGWSGKCPACGAWNTMTEAPTAKTSSGKDQSSAPTHTARQFSWTDQEDLIKLSEATDSEYKRMSSGIPALDRLLGGGITEGGVTLLGGEPGIGKSTVLLQAASSCDAKNVLYVSGEESPSQIALRAGRLGVNKEKITVLTGTCFERIAEELMKLKPDLCIIDSIQTLYSEGIAGTPGSVSQAREVTAGLVRLAKTNSMPIFLVGHVTKDGSIAGPKTLEHMVDTVLSFEGENLGSKRILRSVKNRFGRSGEVALFDMGEKGLIEVSDFGSALIAGRPVDVPGSSISATVEGSRAIAVEIQALMTPSSYQNAQRMSVGLDRNRITMLLAVADKHLKLGTAAYDLFINIAGGLTVKDPALDLAIIAAAVSSIREVPIASDTMIIGELGLTGGIRKVASVGKRIRCAKMSGMKTLVLPSACKDEVEKITEKTDEKCDKIHALEFLYVDNIAEAIDVLFSK